MDLLISSILNDNSNNNNNNNNNNISTEHERYWEARGLMNVYN